MTDVEIETERGLDSLNLVSTIEAILAEVGGPTRIRMREIVEPTALLLFLRWLDHVDHWVKIPLAIPKWGHLQDGSCSQPSLS